MKEITRYECEFCGAMFEDEDECAMHELIEHGVKQYRNEIHCYNYNGNPIDLIDLAGYYSSLIDAIAYIKCDSIEAVHAVIQIFDFLGEYSPYEEENCPEGQELDLWYYPTDDSKENPINGLDTMLRWVNLTYIKNEITSRMEAIGIEERKI